MNTLTSQAVGAPPEKGAVVTIRDNGQVQTVVIQPDTGLVGLTEIADIFGVSRQRVGQLTKRDDFPGPLGTTKAGSVWLRARIEVYEENRQERVDRYLGVPKRKIQRKGKAMPRRRAG